MAPRLTRIRQFEIQNQKIFLGRGFLGGAQPWTPRLQVMDPPLSMKDIYMMMVEVRQNEGKEQRGGGKFLAILC